ncbi:hypothetical protein NA57DRAFT_53306 [Rhizodiscina lignyota]|uniref:protein O-GlcNAc transferase n=1 Tax=Rhizodiscina lignyota TaxID=1504668 RepID=A0A9P4IGU5_9PEZI|nr:hypothetical protein NA57DRAFT_53306 [Rhizodiscina lignyota]
MSLIHPSPPAQPPPHLMRANSYNAQQLPAHSPRVMALRGSRGPQQQSSRLPQQYAHPLLHRTHSFDPDSSRSSSNTPHASEHMLRRKTPNGVLSAAYDGTTVAQNDRPHAMKHILLPVSESISDTSLGLPNITPRDLPLRSSASNYTTDVSLGKQRSQPQNQVWDPGVQGGFGPENTWMAGQNQNNAQIDSMLNQIPLQQLSQLQQNGVFYNFMPTNISPAGPTISNDIGPFGPYWPNGQYVPYRPAALRDMRYYPQYSGNWMSPVPTAVQNWSGGMPNVPNGGQNALNYLNQPQFSVNMLGMGPQTPSKDQAPAFYPHDMPLNSELPGPLDKLKTYTILDTSGQTTPRATQTPVPVDFGPHSSNAALRERVFTWAHSVYVNLLEYLKHTRRAANSNRHIHGYHHASRPNIYPKPPRQQNYDFQTHVSMRRSSDQRVSYRPQPAHAGVNNANIELASQEMLQQANSPAFGSSHAWPSQHVRDPRSMPQVQQPSWPGQMGNMVPNNSYGPQSDRLHVLRRSSGSSSSISSFSNPKQDNSPTATAISAVESLTELCRESAWQWIEGILLGGCLAYALSDYNKALRWYSKILEIDSSHVEAMSNLAATCLAMNRKQDAEQHWLKAVKLRPSYFEAVEHLVGLLCGDHRGKDAVGIIEFVERSLALPRSNEALNGLDRLSERSSSTGRSPSLSDASDRPHFDYDGESEPAFPSLKNLPGSDQPGFGSSGFAIPGADNGRMLQLVHAKGNMLYAMGDNAGAAKAFEGAVLIGAGRKMRGIDGLIKHILDTVSHDDTPTLVPNNKSRPSTDPVLLPPDKALATARLCFPSHGELPGLKDLGHDERIRKAAVSTTSNSLLSLAKIFQDGMASNSPKATAYQTTYGVREILALYYLSLSLQPSPSTANNVGILLASVQQTVSPNQVAASSANSPRIPGVVPGSGIALALAYYNYGLNLDSHHAHLYTNLGSLLKDIGQLTAAIKMYEQAVACDGNFDIALANLANAVKDQNRIADAITYYRRAVQASPDFAEAVCGLANALNSVCGWQGRGGIAADGGRRDRWHVDDKGMLLDSALPGAVSTGWIKRVVDLVEKQLADGEDWGRGIINANFLGQIIRILPVLSANEKDLKEKEETVKTALSTWSGQKWEGARLIRLAERAIRRLGWQWYQDKYVEKRERPAATYARPYIPSNLTVPAAPTVLPFHTFTCPMSAKQIRLISQRNGLRISCSTLKAPWLPQIIYKPPAPPDPYLKVGYVSSDFNNHPLAHLMQSVFGMHDTKRVRAYCYATTASDNSIHRHQIEREAPVFYDASSWAAERLVNQIVNDGIHILVNLNGYTRGARNEVFAARPAPIHMSFMGFAGTLGAEWCDYLLADETAIPPSTLRPWRRNVDLEDQLRDENSGSEEEDWVYGENIIYCKDTFFCCDHRQSAPDAKGEQLDWEGELRRRWNMRKEIFPQLPDDVIILGNFNQLYKIEPTTFRTWLRILARLPKAVLWLLRFPDLGETHLRQTATLWAGAEVASRILFTDVAPKPTHIARARVCDLFLDTPECNAHTTAADVLWSGTPLLTLPRYQYKMCSRMAASILKGALPKTPEGAKAAKELVVRDEDEYEEAAVRLASGCRYEAHKPRGRLAELRRLIYGGRWEAPLFDTKRWVKDLESAYEKAWERWVKGEGGDIWLGNAKR